MQAFERRDWVEGQMRQQVASFSEYVACTLLAAGSRPPPWLLPHSAAATRTRQGALIYPSGGCVLLVALLLAWGSGQYRGFGPDSAAGCRGRGASISIWISVC